MGFKEQLKADVSGVFLNVEEFAVPVVYDSEDGTIIAKAINAIKHEKENEQFADVGASNRAIWLISAVDIEMPEVYDTITYKSVIYTVVSGGVEKGDDDGIWQLTTDFERRSNPSV